MSILKPRKPRQPLQAVNLGHNDEEEDTTEVRRRRVSFAGVNKIKEFNSEAESVLICDTPAYEEEFGNSSDSSLILRNLNPPCSTPFAQQSSDKEVHGDSDMDLSCINMGVETVQPIYCVSQRSSSVHVEEISNIRHTSGYAPEYGHYQDDINLSEDYMDITGTASPKCSPARMSQHQISSMKMSLDCSLMPDVSHRSFGGINRSNLGQEIFHSSSVSDMEMATEYINKENLLNGRRSHCPDQSKLEKSVSSNFQVCSSYLSNSISSVNDFKPNHVRNNNIDRQLAVPMNLRNFIVTDSSKSQFTQSPSHKRYRLSQLPDSEMEVTQVNNSIPLTNKYTNEINNSTNLNFYQGTDHLANKNPTGNMYTKQPHLEQHAVGEQDNQKTLYSENNYLKSNLLDCSLLQAVDSESPKAYTTQDSCKPTIEFHSSLGQVYPVGDYGKQSENEGLGSANVSMTCVSAPGPYNFPEGCAKITNSFNSTALIACHNDSDSLCISMNSTNIIPEQINLHLNKHGEDNDSGTKNKTTGETSCGFIRKSIVDDAPSSPIADCSLMDQTKIVTVGSKDIENLSLTSKMLANSVTGSFQNKSITLNKSDSKRKLEEMRKDDLLETCSQARVDQVFCNKNLIAKRYSQTQNYNYISQDIESEVKQSPPLPAINCRQSIGVTKDSLKRYSQEQAVQFELHDFERAKDIIDQSSHKHNLNPEEDTTKNTEEIVNESTKNVPQIPISQCNSTTADSSKRYSQVPVNDSARFSYELKDSVKKHSQVPNPPSDTGAVEGLNNPSNRSSHSALFPLGSNYYSETTNYQIPKPEIVPNDDSKKPVEISRHEVLEDNNKNHIQKQQMEQNKILTDELVFDRENSQVAHDALCEQNDNSVEKAKELQTHTPQKLHTPELTQSDKVNDSVNVTAEEEYTNDNQVDDFNYEQNSVGMELEKLSWNPLIEESELPEEYYTRKIEYKIDAEPNKENEVSSPLIVDASCTSEFKKQSSSDVSVELINPTCNGVVNESIPPESSVTTSFIESSETNVIRCLSSDNNEMNKSSGQINECSINEPGDINSPLYVNKKVESIIESTMDVSVSDEVNQMHIEVAESSVLDSPRTSFSDVKKPGDIFSLLQLHNKHFMENLGYHFFEWTRWTKKFFNKSITLHVNVSWIQFDIHTPILDASLQLEENGKGKALKFCSSEIVRKLNELAILKKFKTLEDTDRIFNEILRVVKDITPLYESLQNLVLFVPSDIISGRLVIYLASIKSVTAADIQINLANWDSLTRNDITIVTHVGKISLSNVKSIFFSIPSGKERFYDFACALDCLIGNK